MPVPDFRPGEVLTAAAMESIGLWLVKTQTVGTGVSSVVVNDAFSSTYDNYFITMAGGTGSSAAAINMQLNGSSTGYYGFLVYGASTGSAITGVGENNVANFAFVGGIGVGGQAAHVSCHIYGPALATYTKLNVGFYQNSNLYGNFGGEHRVGSSFTGFTIAPGVGTLTGGTIRVYGYRN